MRNKTLFVLLALSLQTVWACNVPVFRYALANWPADAYELVLYHQHGRLPADVDSILQNEINKKNPINLDVKKIEVSSEQDKTPARLPWLELYYPAHSHIREAVWAGPCTRANLLAILHSKARSRVSDMLLKGDAMVWIVLTCGDQRLDAKAISVVQNSLAVAQQTLKIPDTGTDIHGNPIPVTDFQDLAVAFNYVEVDRADSAEYVFVQMLLQSESDLRSFNQPMAFPIFGRGRLLYALVGDGVNEKNILDACQSAITWCSCEIKALNPGIDLLLAADWSRSAPGTLSQAQQLSPIVGLGDFAPAAPKSGPVTSKTVVQQKADTTAHIDVVAKEPHAAVTQISDPRPDPMHKNLLILAGGIGLFLLIGSIVLLVRKRGR
jgi:hypothetical protein